jgi:predicted nucleic acid-binding protein
LIVVDAAALVDALTLAPGTDGLRARLDGEDLNAPFLLDHEVVSALRGLTLGGHLSAERALDALSDFEDLQLTRWECTDALRRRMFALRANLSAYDAAYVALAEVLDCPLVTRDARIERADGHQAAVEVL